MTDQAPGVPVVFTPALALTGVNATGTLSISGDPSARYKLGDASLTNSDTQVSDVDKAVEVQVTTSLTAGASVTATLSIAGKTVDCVATTRSDVTAPTASILFPPARSLTEGASVVMRGMVKDEDGGSGVKSVKVNGVAATVDTAKGTWELTAAALTDGVNNLKLVVEDVAGNVNEDAAHVSVTKGDITQAFPADGGVDFVGPQTVAWDNLDGRNRALVMDVDAKALVAVDLNTGVRNVLSSNSTQVNLPFIYDLDGFNGAAIAVDKTRKLAFVSQATKNSDGEIFEINLMTGNRASNILGTVPSVSDLALDKSNGFDRLFDSASEQGSINLWDFKTSQRAATYSDSLAYIPDNSNPFDNSGSIAIDASRNRLLMTTLTGNQFIYSIDISLPDTDNGRGVRKVFSNSVIPNDSAPFSQNGNYVLTSIRVDVDRDRALLVDRLKPAIFALTLSDDKTKDGARSVLSSNDKSSVNKFIDPYGLHIEASMNYAIVVDKGQKAVMAVDLESGERVVVSKSKN